MSLKQPSHSFPFAFPIVEESQVVFDESIVKLKRDRLRLEDHTRYTYYTLMTKPFAVVILARTSEGLYVLNEEYRHPTGQVLLSCPGGYMDENEDPLEAAARELLEETGYQAEKLELMGSAFPYAGLSSQKTLYVRAFNAKFVTSPHLETSEILQTILKAEVELQAAIQQGVNLDGTLCTALFFDRFNPAISK